MFLSRLCSLFSVSISFVETGFSFPFFLSVFCPIHTRHLLRLISPLFIFDPYFPTSRLGNICLGKYRWPFDNASRRNFVAIYIVPYYVLKLNSVALVRTRTIPTERPPPVGEVSANFCG